MIVKGRFPILRTSKNVSKNINSYLFLIDFYSEYAEDQLPNQAAFFVY
ncbi:hypothetical protein KIS4809_5693 [Bacillus sp. ZZV12-4809]|nr:hypothetical protein KIS4809_5693 [Bacillus sp. ZZV12-4809]